MKTTHFIIIIISIFVTIFAILNVKEEKAEKNKEQAILDYYESVETLLDSLYIDCGDTVFTTNVGTKYIESKYKFDSLFINNDRRN